MTLFVTLTVKLTKLWTTWLRGRQQITDPAAQRLFDNQMAEAIDVANDGLKGVIAGGFASVRGTILKAS